MADQKWNWKNSLLSFLVGFIVGRYTKGGSRPFVYKGSDGVPTECSDEEVAQAAMLWIAVAKEAARELGYDPTVSESEVREFRHFFDADAAMDRARQRYIEQVGAPPPEEEFQQASRWGKQLFFNRLLPLMSKLGASAVPAVPIYASPPTFGLCSYISDRLFVRMKERDPDDFSSWARSAVPQLESLLNKWVRESKPDTYTKPLLQAIHSMKAQM